MKKSSFFSLIALLICISCSDKEDKVCTCTETNIILGTFDNYSETVSEDEDCSSLNSTSLNTTIICIEN